MTKPHEETWTVDEESVRDGDYIATTGDGFVVLTVYARSDEADSGGDELAEARLRQATAAPDMARALLEMLEDDGHLPHCSGATTVGCIVRCGEVRAALTKAGVPLP